MFMEAMSGTNTITNEIYIESFKVNNSITPSVDMHLRNPYFKFIT